MSTRRRAFAGRGSAVAMVLSRLSATAAFAFVPGDAFAVAAFGPSFCRPEQA
jgi:hypothetical protein